MNIQLLEKKELIRMTLEELKKLKGELETTLEEENTNIEELIADEKVKEYISHAKIKNKILELKPILDLELKKKQMLGCYHIWVKTYVNSYYDEHRYEKEIDYTCVKCGLDTRMIKLHFEHPEKNTIEEIMSYVYSLNRRGRIVNTYCKEKDAITIYNKLINDNPNLTDEEIVEELTRILSDEKAKIRMLKK